MSRPFWVGLTVSLLGGLASYAAGCGSSNNGGGGGGGNGGGACCVCISAECNNNTTTVSPPAGIASIPDCTMYCQSRASFLANCTGSSASNIVGTGVACPKDGGTSTGLGGGGAAGSTGTGGGLTGAGGSVGLGGATGAGTGGNSMVDAGAAAILGKACTSDTQCGGLHCARSTDNDFGPGSGVPNGMCTLPCSSANGGNPCGTVGGACITYTTSNTGVRSGLCMPLCDFANPLSATTSCGGRGDQACLLFNGFSACVPVCETDADCGSRKCDIGSGACVDTVAPNKLGSFCMSDTDCGSGFCLTDDVNAMTGPGTCTAFCRLGTTEGCGYRRTAIASGTTPVGSCFFATNLGTETAQDFGFCYQLCDSTSDCSRSTTGWGCFMRSDITQAINHGVCIQLTPADAGVTDSAPPSGG